MMDQKVKDDSFLTLVDFFLEKANQQGKDHSITEISAAFLYAASRYNVFRIASSCEDKAQFIRDADNINEYFRRQYAEMFQDNFDEFLDKFENYHIKPAKK